MNTRTISDEKDDVDKYDEMAMIIATMTIMMTMNNNHNDPHSDGNENYDDDRSDDIDDFDNDRLSSDLLRK